jgi:hypothetical protein
VLTGGDEEITWPFGLDENISYDGNRLKTAIRFANRKVLEATRERTEYEGMATTVAAVLVDGDSANLGHVGDSRVYLVRGGTILVDRQRIGALHQHVAAAVAYADDKHFNLLVAGGLPLSEQIKDALLVVLVISGRTLRTLVPANHVLHRCLLFWARSD